VLYKPVQVIGVSYSPPTPTECTVQRDTGVIDPALVYEVAVAIWSSGPGDCGDSIDNLQGRVRSLTIFNVYVRPVPFDDVSRFVS
jgi:hypothetical protein